MKTPNTYLSEYKAFTELLGHFFFIILTSLSVIFYQERLFYLDPSFFSFQILTSGDFSIALQRWGSVLSQIPPLLALSFDVTLKTFLILYSVSFILVFYIFFLILFYKFKDVELSLVLILSLCITSRLTFYYPTAELQAGTALCCIIWFLVRKYFNTEGKAYKYLILIILLSATASYFHQLLLLLVIFSIGFEFLETNKRSYNKLFLVAGLTMLFLFIRMKILDMSSYESQKTPSPDIFLSHLFSIGENQTLPTFIDFFFKKTVLITLLFLAGILKLLRTNVKSGSFVAIFTISFFILISVTLHNGESEIMKENYLFFFGFFFSIPILRFVSEFKYNRLIVVVMVCYSIVGISNASSLNKLRLKHLENLVAYGQQFTNRKFIIKNSCASLFPQLHSWAAPFETLLLSSEESPIGSTTFYMKPDEQVIDSLALSNPHVFLGPDWAPTWYTSSSLPSQYFVLPDGPYLNLNTSQDYFNDKIDSIDNSNIKILVEKAELNKGEQQFISIYNLSDHIINSIPGSSCEIYISYHLYNEYDSLISWDNTRTRLLLDIHPHKYYAQPIFISYPTQAGKYNIVLDMVVENKKWLDINTRFNLIVN